MTVHLVKICVGAKSIDDLVAWHDTLRARAVKTGVVQTPSHTTRMFPKRSEEILAGGSLYWTMNSVFAVRQRIIGLTAVVDDDGIKRCRIDLSDELVPVQPVPRRPFQGWRYLEPNDAPKDIAAGQIANADSQALHQTLSSLGLL
ncbi:MAG: DUF1489 domain-containing protein [Pseudomonadota bacterium]